MLFRPRTVSYAGHPGFTVTGVLARIHPGRGACWGIQFSPINLLNEIMEKIQRQDLVHANVAGGCCKTCTGCNGTNPGGTVVPTP